MSKRTVWSALFVQQLLQDEVTGVDPSVFRRYFREEEEEPQERDDGGETETNTAGGYNRSDVRDYKMPRRKTTRRKKKKPPDSDRWFFN